MSDTREAGKMILENLGMFNEAVRLYEECIQPEIFSNIEQLVKRRAEAYGWECADDWENTGIWVAPVEWNASENNKEAPSKAHFSFWWEEKDVTNSYELADICGVGQTTMGFWFEITPSTFGGKTLWNAFAKTISAEMAQKIAEFGFRDKEKGTYFLPVKLQHMELASAWINEDYAECLKPINDALETLKAAQGVFDDLLTKALTYAENKSAT